MPSGSPSMPIAVEQPRALICFCRPHGNACTSSAIAPILIFAGSRLVATAEEDRLSTTIWSGGAAAGLYLGTELILAFLVHTHYPGALGLREWIRVVLSWPLIFFLRSK
jgi:hypothetical protein